MPHLGHGMRPFTYF